MHILFHLFHFVSIFHGSFALAFTSTNILERVRNLLGVGTECGQGRQVLLHIFPPQLPLIPAFVQGKELKIHFCDPIFQQKALQQVRAGWHQVAKENGMKWNCVQTLRNAGKDWLLLCFV